MRDYKNIFGVITAGVSANTLDFGPIDGRSEFTAHHTGAQHDSTVVVGLAAAQTAALTVKVQDCDTATGTYADVETAVLPIGTPAGANAVCKMPINHRQFVRVATTGGNGAAEAWIEPGPDNR